MSFKEIFRLAFFALGANKLRSGLTMLGITIGVFSVISVMTATGALQGSIESGLSFLGSNIFQFSKYPAAGSGRAEGTGAIREPPRRDLRAGDGLRAPHARHGSGHQPEVFRRQQARSSTGGSTRTPTSTSAARTRISSISNGYTIEHGRNLNETDVDLARSVAVIGRDIQRRLFPLRNRSARSSRSTRKTTRSSACSRKRAVRSGAARTTSCSCRSRAFSRISATRGAR